MRSSRHYFQPMPRSNWIPIFKQRPDDAAFVWVRRDSFQPPIKATYTVDGFLFTLETGEPLPWWAIDSWSPT